MIKRTIMIFPKSYTIIFGSLRIKKKFGMHSLFTFATFLYVSTIFPSSLMGLDFSYLKELVDHTLLKTHFSLDEAKRVAFDLRGKNT